jgi:hypothetical protein
MTNCASRIFSDYVDGTRAEQHELVLANEQQTPLPQRDLTHS